MEKNEFSWFDEIIVSGCKGHVHHDIKYCCNGSYMLVNKNNKIYYKKKANLKFIITFADNIYPQWCLNVYIGKNVKIYVHCYILCVLDGYPKVEYIRYAMVKPAHFI